MARPKISDRWIERIKGAYAAAVDTPGKKSSAAAIARELEALGPGCPSRRTIQRIIEEFKKLPDVDQREYSIFRWPQSMEQGALPWEASSDLFALHRELLERTARTTKISVRFARWYWRACQAMPDAEVDDRMEIAAHAAIWEVTGKRGHAETEALHWYLVYREWRSPEDHEAYWKAVDSKAFGRILAPSHFVPPGSSPELEDMLGSFAYVDPNWEEVPLE